MERIRYRVIDTHTNAIIGNYSTRQHASRRADKLDLEHGAIRYAVEPIGTRAEVKLAPQPERTRLVLP
jgi:hypothetical protein